MNNTIRQLDGSLLNLESVPTTRSAYRLTAAALATVAFGICYGGVIASLIDSWLNNTLYSYGFAVPLIAAYIADDTVALTGKVPVLEIEPSATVFSRSFARSVVFTLSTLVRTT